jgi:hypothetical protein
LTILFAQAPKNELSISYSKTNGTCCKYLVGMKISILQEAANGPAVYVETQTPTMNANGLTTGHRAGELRYRNLAGINWASGTYFIKTETSWW